MADSGKKRTAETAGAGKLPFGAAGHREKMKPDDDLCEGTGSLSGSVDCVIYRNDDNGYIVASLETEEGKLISVVGVMPDVNDGDHISVTGRWEFSARYGKQFRVAEYRCDLPTESADLEKYLGSGAIRGIGAKTARRIIEEFGDDTADVIENHPEWLAQVRGITLKRAREISADFREKADIRAAVTFFREYFGASLTMKVYRQLGSHCIEIAKSNPYRLCDEVDGISFEKADMMAQKLGMEHTAPERIASGVLYVLNYNGAMNGHTCLPEDKLTEAAAQTLEVGTEQVTEAIRELVKRARLVAETVEGVRFIYERSLYEDEKFIASKLQRLKKGTVPLMLDDIEGFIRKEEAGKNLHYANEQKRAIFDALTSGVLVLTGGPGTGKTTVVTALIDILESLEIDVALAAPTGRAAKRMTEATQREARTVHRLLEVDFDSDENDSGSAPLKFKRGEKNLLDEHAVIIDEASMLDTGLTAALLRAVRPGSRLILIGDADQLPSVGAGNILRDIISSGCVPTVALTQIFRQAEQSLIVTNAHAINRGEMPRLDVRDRDFFFMPRENDTEISATVADLAADRLPRAYGDPGGIQVIVPSRRGAAGTEALNVMLQARINPPARGKAEHRTAAAVYRVGDRVMQIRNNYELEWIRSGKSGQGIFNGDIGFITSVNEAMRYMDIDFDGRTVQYEFSDLPDLELAYAVTVHKSQGSEYPTVIIPLGNVPRALRTRNLLYTAVTRAQKRVIIVGSAEIVAEMTRNKSTALRYTGLERRLLTANG